MFLVVLLKSDRLGLTKTGQGARVEAIARSIPVLVVPGKFNENEMFVYQC